MSPLLDAISGVPNACEPIHGIVTGGQPAPEHLAALKRAGCAVVIDLREAMEPRPFKTPDALVQAGLEYRHIPMGHGAVSDATFGRLLDAVRELAGKRPALVHCSSGNRVGAGLLPYFMLEQGLEEEDAVTQAMRVGGRARPGGGAPPAARARGAEGGREKPGGGGEEGGYSTRAPAPPRGATRPQYRAMGWGRGAKYTKSRDPPVGTYGRREQPRV